jgi:hypothetical protein
MQVCNVKDACFSSNNFCRQGIKMIEYKVVGVKFKLRSFIRKAGGWL